MKNRIGILGTGAYGIALAKMFHENDCDITMWTKFQDEAKMLLETRMNNKVLPNVLLDRDIKITTNLEEICQNSDILVICIPSIFVKDTIKEIKKYILDDTVFCMASKGIDNETGKFMTDLLLDYFDSSRITIISGPSFAIDMVSLQPTGLSIAGSSLDAVNLVMKNLANDYLKIIPTNDVLGVSVCGAIKNIMAIASGMLYAFNANPSCNAMFLTEAVHEIKALIKKLGGNDRTIMSYAGVGDLFLTCTSMQSRNFTFGYNLVKKSREEIFEYRQSTTIEGIDNLVSIKKILSDRKIEMPIIEVIDNIVNKDGNPKALLDYLMKKVVNVDFN